MPYSGPLPYSYDEEHEYIHTWAVPSATLAAAQHLHVAISAKHNSYQLNRFSPAPGEYVVRVDCAQSDWHALGRAWGSAVPHLAELPNPHQPYKSTDLDKAQKLHLQALSLLEMEVISKFEANNVGYRRCVFRTDEVQVLDMGEMLADPMRWCAGTKARHKDPPCSPVAGEPVVCCFTVSGNGRVVFDYKGVHYPPIQTTKGTAYMFYDTAYTGLHHRVEEDLSMRGETRKAVILRGQVVQELVRTARGDPGPS